MPVKKITKKQTVKKVKSQKSKVKIATKSSKVTSAKKVSAKPVRLISKTVERVQAGLKVEVFDTKGKSAGTISLPKELFGGEINKALMAQAVRVYLANQRQGTVSTKTRGEVQGSSRKIYRQKGTGRARHGNIRAPIFIKGGIVFGPKPRDFSLSLPKRMKKAALISALSAKVASNEIKVLAGLEKIEPKTKEMVSVFKNLGISEKKHILLVLSAHLDNVWKSARNIKGIQVATAAQLNTYDVLKNNMVVFMQPSIEVLRQAQGK